MFGSSSKTGLWAWVIVFLGGALLVADMVSTVSMAEKPKNFEFPTAPVPRPTAKIPADVPPVEMVEVLVATKDLPVGTALTANEKQWVAKKFAKDAVPPGAVAKDADLIDKRLTRAVRAGETFDPQNLIKPSGPTLPDGHDIVSVRLNAGVGLSGFVVPGSRVNVLASLRVGDTLKAFPLVVDVLVVAVDTQTYSKDGIIPDANTVSLAVREKQAILLSLAKERGCNIQLLLRNPDKAPDADRNYDIDEVIKLLSAE